MTTLKDEILELSRQKNIGELSPWFNDMLDRMIERDYAPWETDLFPDSAGVKAIGDRIVTALADYAVQTERATVVLGMSGGVDSALTAALFRDAGYRVIGVTMPIHQNPDETDRGVEACEVLGIEHQQVDLSRMYNAMVETLSEEMGDETANLIRRGNIRARLRMITLYNIAAAEGGFVASTDNYSELAMGFWTLHGDVGDVSPIQSLNKSWEVPALARQRGVPERVWRATPTDGLGVDAGDEAQFGFTYLELDIMLFALTKTNINGMVMDLAPSGGEIEYLRKELGVESDEKANQVFDAVVGRLKGTWFKRMNPVNLKHPLDGSRYSELESLDQNYVPAVLKG